MSLFIFQGINLYVGDTGPDNSKHLNLESVKLPTLEQTTQNHFAGGSIGELEIGGLGLKPLKCTFKIKGYDPQIMSQFGLGDDELMWFTAYGHIVNKNGNKPVALKSRMFARLGKIEADEHKRGDLLGHDHELHEIQHYELFFDGQEKFYYDWLTSTWRVDGVARNTDFRKNLAIPGAA